MTGEAQALQMLADPAWRLAHMYRIVDKAGQVVAFRPNAAQRRLLANLHTRNVVLKARQLGVSTLACVLWLDTALFAREPLACVIVAQDRQTAGHLFGKVRFAYEQLPQPLRAQFRLAKQTAEEMQFAHNGASIRVATSARGGTIHRLHISEMGKIGARFPEKAREIVTGSIPAVPLDDVVIVESTAEGASGRFYEMVRAAAEVQASGRELSPRDWRLHFFPWWGAPEYVMPAEAAPLSVEDVQYFAEVEQRCGVRLTPEQKAWYAATLRGADMAGERPLMWQEYPSHADEPFKTPQEGCYWARQLLQARADGRILPSLPVEAGAPVDSFWDIGANDNTAIWLMQRVGVECRFIRFYKASGEPLEHYVRWLQAQGVVFGRHWLPHDAGYARLGAASNASVQEMLARLMPGHRFEVLERTPSVLAGIEAARQALAVCLFDERQCAEGLRDLAAYRKAWDARRGTWKDAPFHGPESDSADAFRQFAQARAAGLLGRSGAAAAVRQFRRRRDASPMAV